MNPTTRVITVLAGAIVLVAPVVNTVLDETLASADRSPFQETDWRVDPPDGDPPDDPPEGDEDNPLEEEREGGPTSQCEIEEHLVAGWHHPSPEEDPAQAVQNRTASSTQTFTVTEDTMGLGIHLEATNVTGALEASVYPQGDRSQAPFYEQRSNMILENMEATSTVSQDDLTLGTWEALLNHWESNHEELTFIVVAFTCIQEENA